MERYDGAVGGRERGAASVFYTSGYGVDSGTGNESTTNPPAEWPSSLYYYQDDSRNHGFRGNNPMAKLIAIGWRDYGLYIGDNAGSGCRVKLQNFGREDRANPRLIGASDFQTFSFNPVDGDFEFIDDNYDPPAV